MENDPKIVYQKLKLTPTVNKFHLQFLGPITKYTKVKAKSTINFSFSL